jgi:hypothetical protein
MKSSVLYALGLAVALTPLEQATAQFAVINAGSMDFEARNFTLQSGAGYGSCSLIQRVDLRNVSGGIAPVNVPYTVRLSLESLDVQNGHNYNVNLHLIGPTDPYGFSIGVGETQYGPTGPCPGCKRKSRIHPHFSDDAGGNCAHAHSAGSIANGACNPLRGSAVRRLSARLPRSAMLAWFCPSMVAVFREFGFRSKI